MAFLLLTSAVIILSCIFCTKLSGKFGIPMLLIFIFIGMVFGSDGVFKIDFENYKFAETICSIALIFIMFYGGFGTNFKRAKPVIPQALILSTAGVIFTALFVCFFCHYILKINFFESFLIGATLSSTDAASVFNVLRNNELSLKDNTDSMLEIESGSNDPCAYMLTAIILSVMKDGFSIGYVLYTIFAQFVYGVICGLAIALATIYFLKKFKFEESGFGASFMIAIALISYALPSVIGGNGYLSAYIVGIIIGNNDIPNKKALVNFFDGITSLMQILIFFILGLLSSPSKIPSVFIPAICIVCFLTFIARPIVAAIILKPFKANLSQFITVSWAGLRGAASIVFAIMAIVSDVYTDGGLFHIVFCVVLISIGFQGSLLPFVAKKVNALDYSGNVLKTFNDYSDELTVSFIKIHVKKSSTWANKMIKDIPMLSGILIVLIKRGSQSIIPTGNTEIKENDIIVLSAASYDSDSADESIQLKEIKVDKYHDYTGKKLSDIKFGKNKLVILIKRGEKTLVPNGETLISNGDTLVLGTIKP